MFPEASLRLFPKTKGGVYPARIIKDALSNDSVYFIIRILVSVLGEMGEFLRRYSTIMSVS
jgi:hypoxanthine phosphoribosyltransferase